MEFPKRKHTRIPGYDYATHNYYFVTICTHNRNCIFWEDNALSQCGKIAEEFLLKIPEFYPQVMVDKCVVMPNHVHGIFIIRNDINSDKVPNIANVIGQYKMSVTKRIRQYYPNCEVWQRSFHDHIIRNRKGYDKIWEYIENNPLKWEEDCFYQKDSKD